ncbi:MAG TPA: CoA-binding protein [Dehalococcoidia bacterium]|nr:CoA-binding protein [Dehalococcoidia bacterium]
MAGHGSGDDGGVHPLEAIFHPRGIAVAGVSISGSGFGGNMFIQALKQQGFAGGIYPVNPKATADTVIDGERAYPNLAAIPGPVDYVISSVPARAVLDLLEDARRKGVRTIHFFTAGFRETGDAERAELEEEVLRRARAAGIRLIGPNCMGIYAPAEGITFQHGFPRGAGEIGVLSQSGLNATEIITYGAPRGLRFSKVISFGNATDLNESDFLDYLAHDPQTSVIAGYIEGVRDGRRFLRTAQEASTRKRLTILKGGLTDAGGRATSSHTGSLAGSAQVWQALQRQAGFVLVETLEELVDCTVMFRFVRELPGRRVAIVGGGGGTSVLAADACSRAGLQVPTLAAETRRLLAEFTPDAGTSVRNPVDTMAMWRNEGLGRTLEIVANDPQIDMLLLHTQTDWANRPGNVPITPEQFVMNTVETAAATAALSGKPIVVALRTPLSVDGMGNRLMMQSKLAERGLASYPSVHRAAAALARLAGWQEWRTANRA